jgi:hypothetical protein
MSWTAPEGFERTWVRLRALAEYLASDEAMGLTLAEVEARLAAEHGPLMRQFLQDALDLWAREPGGGSDASPVPPSGGEPARDG